jgi:site-specific DNA recombinase
MSPDLKQPVKTDETACNARAVIYLRVSTKEQAERGGETEGFSIPAQREACIRKAASIGAVVVDEFADRGESAKTAARPALQEMLKFIKDEAVQYVIVHKIDRLARNRADDVAITLAIKTAGATLVSCTENIDETPSGHLMHGIMSSIAEFYSRNLANEVLKGSTQKAAGGGTVGKAPTGYLNVRKFENGIEFRTVEVDVKRGPLMRWAFESYSSGDWSTRTLHAELLRRGLDSTPSAQKPSKPLSLSNLCRLLRHPYYKGLVRYRGVEYPGNHEPLVSIETWDRVQELLSEHDRTGLKQREHHHYLKGSVFCGNCGGQLIITNTTNRHGTSYAYFICVSRHQKRNSCEQSAVPISIVEAKVELHYLTVQPFSELVMQIKKVLKEELERNELAAVDERIIQRVRIQKLEDQRAKLLQGYYNGAIPGDLLKTEQSRITSELAHAKQRSEALDIRFEEVEKNIEIAMTFASDWHHAYRASSDKERRRLNRAIFQKIFVLDNGEISDEMAEPFRTLLGREVGQAAIDRFHLTRDESEAIDEAWAQLSAKWATEQSDQLLLVGSPVEGRKTQTPDTLGVGGLKACFVVGVEGLEPPTSAL